MSIEIALFPGYFAECLGMRLPLRIQQPLVVLSSFLSSLLAPPSPPSDFHVDKSLVHSMLLVCWQPPLCDEGGRSNGCLVTGYQLYVNNQATTMVTGASQAKVRSSVHVGSSHNWLDSIAHHQQTIAHAHTHTHICTSTYTQQLLPGLDLSEPITLGISTCSQEGLSSEIVTITYPEQPPTVSPVCRVGSVVGTHSVHTMV